MTPRPTRLQELNRECQLLHDMRGEIPAVAVSTSSRPQPTSIDVHCEHPDIGPMRGDPVPVSTIQIEIAAMDLSSEEKARRYADLPLDTQLYH